MENSKKRHLPKRNCKLEQDKIAQAQQERSKRVRELTAPEHEKRKTWFHSDKLDRILNICQVIDKRITRIENHLSTKSETENDGKNEKVQEDKKGEEAEQKDGGDREDQQEDDPTMADNDHLDDGNGDVGSNREDDAPSEENEDSIRQPNTQDGSYAGDDEQDRHKHNSTDLKGASASKSSCNREGVSKQASVSEGTKRSATLLGLDILDCPICFEALTIPIFQCDNGHLACSSCCPKLSNKCPTCALPVGHNRSRAMESVLESVFVPCQNAKFGCTKNVSYGKESTHEKECNFSQCFCPALDCNYTGSYSDIYTHFVDKHCHESKSVSFVCGGLVDIQMNIATNKTLVLWESKKRLLFALQCFNVPRGVYVTFRCIAPSAPELGKLACCLYYSMDGHTLTYKSPEVKMVLKLSSKIPQDNFMFVPHSLLRGESLEMKISIGS